MGVVNDTHILQTQLENYAAQGIYPMHMPGHKRLVQPAPGLPSAWDVTEIPGTDDLHDAHGILLDAMKRTADLCGADRTWYLVNGSTCGLLAGIRALAEHGAEVICARNCHKAVFHAIELAGYRVHWIMPPVDEDWGICGGITEEQVRMELGRHPSAKAVILTSPTYEGILSEVGGIARVCHRFSVPLLVDEAHGAHLMPVSAAAGFPGGALEAGADLTVQSPHKTLPSLTQTALLHLCGNLVDPRRVEAELDIFETSSPSYPLMASLDGCTGILREHGKELFEKWSLRLHRFDQTVRENLRKFRILGHTGEPFRFGVCDPGKILIDAVPAGMSGTELAAILRGKYLMETEMSQGGLLLAMTTICDAEDALDRLAEALIEIEAGLSDEETECAGNSAAGSSADGEMPSKPGLAAGAHADGETPGKPGLAAGALANGKMSREPGAAAGNDVDRKIPGTVMTGLFSSFYPAAHCTIAEAAAQESEDVPIELTLGRICAEYLYFYPPGIPVLAPGEIIREKLAKALKEAHENGNHIYRKNADGIVIRCLRE